MAVSKDVLKQYIDLKEELKEVTRKISKLEEQILRIEEEGTVKDKVFGGEGGNQPFNIEGIPTPEYNRKMAMLHARKATQCLLRSDIEEKTLEVEQFISQIDDSRVRRIIEMRFIGGFSWNEVANNIGGGNSEDGVRMTFERFMQKM